MKGPLIIFLCFFSFLQVTLAQELQYESAQTGNPVIPGYYADPSIVEMDSAYYIYATTVSKFMEPIAWVSYNLENWTPHHLGIEGEHHFWAPSMIKGKDGKYYLFYTNGFDFKCHLYTGTSPIGPFEKYGKVEEGFDLEIFQDPNNGKVYGISSNPASRPRLVEFNNDPSSSGYLKEVVDEIGELKGDFFDYTEGSMIFYRSGWYYLMYSGGKCGDVTYNIRYARSRAIAGPYEQLADNQILAWDAEKDIYGPGHHSVLRLGDEYFICYHRQDKWEAPTCSERQVCIDKLEFTDNGQIKKVKPTHRGVDFSKVISNGSTKENRVSNLAFGKQVTASGNVRFHEPDDAVDDNYATYWSNGRSGKFTVDLGRIYEVHKVIPYFKYYDYYNLYKIEYSEDNVNWSMFFDQTQTAKKAAAPVRQKTVNARYIRITFVRGGEDSASLFELKVLGKWKK